MTLLKVTGLQASYGASQALFDVNLHVNEGEVTALLGRGLPNAPAQRDRISSFLSIRIPEARKERSRARHWRAER